jgi:threonine/homoserine/homoserine lactone efflux protein
MTDMTTEITFLLSGIVFGLSGGLTPGPLLTLVISETLKHGAKEGVKISIAPLISDLPIVLCSIYVISNLANINYVIGTIALLGTIFLIYLGYESINFKGIDVNINQIKPQSIRKGIMANFLNPNPYLFWISVGAPTVIKATQVSLKAAILFVVFMYLFLVGSKMVTALILGKSRVFLKSKHYIYIIKLLGVVLIAFAIIFFVEALKSFGII